MYNRDLNNAKKICFRLFKIRPRSEYEFRSHLLRKGFDKEVIEEVITGLLKIGLIDDLKFARLWVISRIKKPLGLNRIFFELKNKGIDKNIIEKVTEEFKSPQKEEEVIRDLLRQKIKKFSDSKLDKNKIKNRLWGFFMRKGFSKDIVYDVLSQL